MCHMFEINTHLTFNKFKGISCLQSCLLNNTHLTCKMYGTNEVTGLSQQFNTSNSHTQYSPTEKIEKKLSLSLKKNTNIITNQSAQIFLPTIKGDKW